jgi:hypothetical protein
MSTSNFPPRKFFITRSRLFWARLPWISRHSMPSAWSAWRVSRRRAWCGRRRWPGRGFRAPAASSQQAVFVPRLHGENNTARLLHRRLVVGAGGDQFFDRLAHVLAGEFVDLGKSSPRRTSSGGRRPIAAGAVESVAAGASAAPSGGAPRTPLTRERMLRMSSRKPMSSMRSTSSRTTKRMLSKVDDAAIEQVDHPAGRADEDFGPWRRNFIWAAIFWPP